MSTADQATQLVDHVEDGSYHVDPRRTALEFRTRFMLGLIAVKGKFTKYDGTLNVDGQGNASGELRVVTDSIETGIARRDAHLRGAWFFHSAAYPNMVFTLHRLALDSDGHLTAAGVLMIRDKQLAVATPAHLTRASDGSLELRAEFEVDHKAAGLRWAKPGMVPGRVRVLVTIGLVRSNGAGTR